VSGIINLVGTRRGVFCPQNKVKVGATWLLRSAAEQDSIKKEDL